jgi:spermidine synthase
LAAAGTVTGLGIVAFEIAWSNALPAVTGNQTLNHVWSLCSLAAGASAGAGYLGRRSARVVNPLKLLSLLQVGLAICAILAYHLASASGDLLTAVATAGVTSKAALAVIGGASSFAILFIPSFLAGGAMALGAWVFPAGRGLGRAGFVACFFMGCALGVGLFGMGLVPRVGTSISLIIASVAVATAGAIGLLAGVASQGITKDEDTLLVLPSENESGAYREFLHTVYIFAGVAFAVIWMRVLSRLVGETATARDTMLLFLISGVAAGMFAARVALARIRSIQLWLAVVTACSGVLWLVMYRLTGSLPSAFLGAFMLRGGGWTGFVTGYAWASLLTILPVGFLLGTHVGLRPGLGSVWADGATGRQGSIIALAGLGAFTGLAATCYVPAGAIGLGGLLVALSAVGVGCGLGLVAICPESGVIRLVVGGTVAGAFLLLAATSPPWDRRLMAAGIYAEPQRYAAAGDLENTVSSSDLVFYEDCGDRTVAVLRTPLGMVLKVDGAVKAATGEEAASQILSGHIPLLLSRDPRRVLLVGPSVGITLRSVTTHPVDIIDCVEPDHADLAAAEALARYIGDGLADGRVHPAVRAPEFHLLTSTAKYDVIALEAPPNPYTVPDHALTADFAAGLRTRLRPGGIVSLPIKLRNLTAQSFKSILRGFVYHYPYLNLWWTGGDNLLLLASMDPIRTTAEELDRRIALPEVMDDLARVRISDYAGILSCYLMGRDEIVQLAGNAPLIEVERNSLIYDQPKQWPAGDWTRILADVASMRSNPASGVLIMDQESVEFVLVSDRFDRCAGAFEQYVGSLRTARTGQLRQAASLFENAVGSCPENGLYPVLLSDFYIFVSSSLAAERRMEDAIKVARRAVEMNSNSDRAFYNLASLELGRDPATAAMLLDKAIDLNPYAVPAYLLKAEAEMASDAADQAAETLGRVLTIEPFNIRAHQLRAVSLIDRSMPEEARTELETVVDAEPRNVEALVALAYTWLIAGDLGKAQGLYERALKIDPENLAALNNYATVLAERGEFEQAVKMWTRALELDPGNKGIIENIREAQQKASQ